MEQTLNKVFLSFFRISYLYTRYVEVNIIPRDTELAVMST